MHRFGVVVGEAHNPISLEIVQVEPGRTLQDALQNRYDAASEFRLAADAVVLRLPVGMPIGPALLAGALGDGLEPDVAAVVGSFHARDAFARASNRPVHVLGYVAGQHVLSSNLNPVAEDVAAAQAVTAETTLGAIRTAEFDYMLTRSRAIISSPRDREFLAPSRRLVRNFVRVGNLQYDRDAIDAICFWLLPHMPRCAAILTDTWSISSIAFAAAKLAEAQFGGPPRAVGFLPDYLDGSAGQQAQARSTIERLVFEANVDDGRDEVLCIVSATQSGSMRKSMQQIAPLGLNQLKPSFVAILSLGDTGMPSLHDLSTDPRFQLIDAENASGGTPIPIDPQVYFPLTFKDEVVQIDKACASASRTVMDALANHGILHVHGTTSRAGVKVHQTPYLDTRGLLHSPGFIQQLESKIDLLTQQQLLIVAPDEAGSTSIAMHAAMRLRKQGRRTSVFLHHSLEIDSRGGMTRIEQAVVETIRAADPTDQIVIIVDNWQADPSFAQYERSLRNLGYAGKVNFLAGVATPCDEAEWIHAAKRLRQGSRNSAEAALLLPLPRTDQSACSWCAEVRLYARWADRGELPPPLALRAEMLSGRSAGLSQHLILNLGHLPAIQLGPDSFYVQQASSQADAFASMASALQRRRTTPLGAGLRLGPRQFPNATVLKDEDYLRETWTDTLLRACLLRAATVDELVFTSPELEDERTRRIRDVIRNLSPIEHSLAPELLLAAALGKATVMVDDEIRGAVQAIDDEHGTLRYMLDMIAADQLALRR